MEGDSFIHEVLESYSLHYPFIPKNYSDIHYVMVHIFNYPLSYAIYCSRSCLLSFGAESFVFQVAIQKFKDQVI